ncbi:winged helix-turn-helix transcriptional regulator [Candidatus Blastococcus massiliensis]|uniref:winged helix-turn-helix transcriptional regulator n=1 Tax=Candidatus Blastococcus massiliensis TaxID=1470358 RepID=UPI0004BBC5EB|nr:helix-turn-helix domain-containing protein [Candidatus Blastococcus massiliensis]
MPSEYGQFCPVAKAMELLDERWTLLVVRELMLGSRHFNALRRGVPRMSPALLSKRLQTLARAGVVERWQEGNRVSYRLTDAGLELAPIVEAVGRWGVRWVPELGDRDLDPHLLLWDMHRNVDAEAVPDGRTAIGFEFPELPAQRCWWIVITGDGVDVCDVDPGFPVRVTVRSDLRTLTRVWRGDVDWATALRSGSLELLGEPQACRALPRWLALTDVARTPRPSRRPVVAV